MTAPHLQFWARHARALSTPANALTIVTGLGILAAWLLESKLGPQTPVQIVTVALAMIGGAPIFLGAFRGLVKRRSNVDELVTIAIVAAIVGGEPMAAAVVAFMMNFGQMLESLAEHASGDAVSGLLELTPDVARLKTETGYDEVPAEDVKQGDVVLVREGDRIPVDGEIIAGSASVDQSSITGEAIPVRREVSDAVFAGTVNVEGVVEIRATQTGESTTVNRIVRLVEAAKQRSAPVERLAERYARYFTPAILMISATVFAFTLDWHRAIVILIVACPCSLVLATPTAVVAGIARAALTGILVRGGDALEAIGKVTMVAFDKTGTITTGQPRVEQVIRLGGPSESESVRLAAGAEMLSSHPLATAIVDYARTRELEPTAPTTFQARPGRGVVASVSGRSVTVGSHYLLEEPATPVAARPLARQLRAQGLTCLTVGVDGKPSAMVAMRDTVRPGTKEAMADLRTLGIQTTVLLTGDNESVASVIAAEAGIGQIHGELLPAQKLELIEMYQARGERVLMVGDGVNDAPALARADVGLAMGRTGSDIAIESADLVLLGDNLSRVGDAIRLGRRTLAVIKFNVAFSIALNVGAFVAAGFGVLSPIGAAVLHNAGSVFVMITASLMAARKL